MPGETLHTQPHSNPHVHALLERHPGVILTADAPPHPQNGFAFRQGTWQRAVHCADASTDPYGLVELMDNNPMVCADTVSIPGDAATLALIGLGPLIRAGLLAADPVVQLSFDPYHPDLEAGIHAWGWPGDTLVNVQTQDMGTVLAANIFAEIHAQDDWSVIDELFNESYSRSFYVLPAPDGEWSATRVEGQPHALYRLRLTPDEPNGLLTIQVMADRNGKAGAAQLVHAANVMAGFEESLGIS